MFSPASRLDDRSHVWVERSPFPGVDAAIDANFGPAVGRPSWLIAADFGMRYSQEAIEKIPTFEP